jgi:energy-coupling factor transporter ATP-binding protein EcfA2
MQRVAIARAIVSEPSVLFADEPTGNLDTARSVEIMELIVGFNRERGITVVMVTHEADMAAYASRTIRFRDGHIESDERGRRDALMLLNAFVLALREIRRNVLRSSLTALGIIIGVASVIIMVTLGNGATRRCVPTSPAWGSNLLTVMPGQRVGPGGASSSAKPFRRQDVDAADA